MNILQKNKLLIIAPFTSVPGEVKFNRFVLIAELLSKNNNVTIVTSDFNHNNKLHNRSKYYIISDSLNIICLHELGYKYNISIKRFLSHLFFSYNFILYFLKNKKLFNKSTVFAAYPLIFPVFFLSLFKNKYKYRFIILSISQ